MFRNHYATTTPLFSTPLLMFLPLFLAMALMVGCGPEFGDSCNKDRDCGSGRRCDLTAPGGYCTRTPCEEGGCGDSDDAVCIQFSNGDTFCVASCSSNSDCRDKYRCLSSEDGQKKYCYVE